MKKRTVRLDELDADERRLVLALIAAAKADSQKPSPSPEKPTGTAPSKEQRT